MALWFRELGAQEGKRLQAICDTECLADGASDAAILNAAYLENHPALVLDTAASQGFDLKRR